MFYAAKFYSKKWVLCSQFSIAPHFAGVNVSHFWINFIFDAFVFSHRKFIVILHAFPLNPGIVVRESRNDKSFRHPSSSSKGGDMQAMNNQYQKVMPNKCGAISHHFHSMSEGRVKVRKSLRHFSNVQRHEAKVGALKKWAFLWGENVGQVLIEKSVLKIGYSKTFWSLLQRRKKQTV